MQAPELFRIPGKGTQRFCSFVWQSASAERLRGVILPAVHAGPHVLAPGALVKGVEGAKFPLPAVNAVMHCLLHLGAVDIVGLINAIGGVRQDADICTCSWKRGTLSGHHLLDLLEDCTLQRCGTGQATATSPVRKRCMQAEGDRRERGCNSC